MAEKYAQYVLPEPESSLDTPTQVSQDGVTQQTSGLYQSANFVPGVSGWKFTSDNAELNIPVSVDSLDIPDTVTADSFHTDTNGNSWWGATTLGGNPNATILKDGSATFKAVSIGGTTVQYVITNSGIFSFGDGSDGDATCDGSTAVAGMSRSGSIYTLTRDVYFDDLTVDSGVTVKTAGYRIFAKGTLSVSGTIQRNGNAGGVGGDGGTGGGAGGAGGTGGAALSDGYLKGTVVGGDGGIGSAPNNGNSGDPHPGANGTDVSNSLGTDGVGGTSGGAGGGGAGAGTGGTGGVATASNVKLIANWHLATLLDVTSSGSTTKFTGMASAAGGGSGGGGTQTSTGGGGGGGGSPGGILAIYARVLTVTATGSITTTGGAGGNGGAGAPGTPQRGGGGGAGGTGGNGGILILTYNTYTNGGSVTAAGGAGGTGGTGGTGSLSNGADGSNGSSGSAGIIYQFALSL